MAYTNPFWAASETETPENQYSGTGSAAIDSAVGSFLPGASSILGGVKGVKDAATVKRFDFSGQNPVSFTAVVFTVVIIVAFIALFKVIKN